MGDKKEQNTRNDAKNNQVKSGKLFHKIISELKEKLKRKTEKKSVKQEQTAEHNENYENNNIKEKVQSPSEKSLKKSKTDKTKSRFRNFLLNHKTSVRIVKLSLISIAILTIIYFSFLNVRFSIKEDLLINIPQRHIELSANQNTPAELEIESSIQTSVLCRAICREELTNVNSGEKIYSQEYNFARLKKLEFRKELYPYILGEGQDIYSYKISCTNIQTGNCPVKDSNVEKNIIITVTRTLTEHEKKLQNEQKIILDNAFSSSNNATLLIDLSQDAINQIKYAKSSDLIRSLLSAREEEQKFSSVLQTALDAWMTYNHTHTNDVLKNIKIEEHAKNITQTASGIYFASLERISIYNFAVNKSYELQNEILQSKNIISKSRQFISPHNSADSEIAEAYSLLNYSARKLTTKDYESFEPIIDALDVGNISIMLFQKEYIKQMENNYNFTKAQLDLDISMQDACQILEGLNKINNKTPNSNCISANNNIAGNLIDYSKANYSELSSNVSAFCSELSTFYNIKNEIDNLSIFENETEEFELFIKDESAKHRLHALQTRKNELSSRNDYSANISKIIIDNYINTLMLQNNISNFSAYNSNFVQYFEPLSFTLSGIENCSIATAQNSLSLSYELEPSFSINNDSQKYKKSLPPLAPRACFNGICENYIENSKSNYPLIIVHGHGFYSKNTRITPSQVHNELQDKLFDEKLFIPAGILRYDSEIIENSLSHINASFVYKASYYPDEILNNESIELFADRLDYIIEQAKLETGKDKVIIISHSMGGLVTRAYLRKYGTRDVQMVIIGGTPNYGVTSETVTLCKLFGRNLECDEMYEKSEFINDLKTEPRYNIPIYTLRGEGCATFGADGDGVVQSSKVPLPYAKNYAFNGTCSITGGYHVNLLSPDHNPLIYEKIKELILKHRK